MGWHKGRFHSKALEFEVPFTNEFGEIHHISRHDLKMSMKMKKNHNVTYTRKVKSNCKLKKNQMALNLWL